jgi:hypothetical protein
MEAISSVERATLEERLEIQYTVAAASHLGQLVQYLYAGTIDFKHASGAE